MNTQSVHFPHKQFGALTFFFLVSAVANVSGQATVATGESTRPLRLAIAEFAHGPQTNSLQEEGRVLVDLLTGRIAAEPGFELVERAALDRVLSEISLSVSAMTKPDQAIKVGKIVRADWFLLGSFLQIEGTNFIIAKIVDAQTGVVRDLTSVGLTKTNLPSNADALAAFIISSRKSVRTLSDRLFIAMGAFEDLGLYARYPDFGAQLRTAMTQHYQGSRISVVERSQVTPLLNELRLSLGGLSEPRASGSTAQPAFLIVDGLYQSFQDEQSKINVVLRIEPLGGRMRVLSLKELPGKPLETKVADAIERALRDVKTTALTPSREAEFKAQLNRGKQLARTQKDSTVLGGLPPADIYRDTRVPVITDAIHAFESALLLNPDSVEAKFYLAVCLNDPQIDKREQARDYWREVVASSTNAQMVLSSREAIATSYLGQDDSQAVELLSSLKKDNRGLQDTIRYNSHIERAYLGLYRTGGISRQSFLDQLTDSWRTICRSMEANATAGGRIDSYQGFELPCTSYYPAFTTTPNGQRDYVAGVVSNLMVEFPRLNPYLVSGYMRFVCNRSSRIGKETLQAELPEGWLSKYLEVLTKCEQHPETVPAPATFYSGSLLRDLGLFVHRRAFDLAERAADLLDKRGRSYLPPGEKDQLDFVIGCLNFQQEKWKAALTAFERIGDRTVSVWEGLDQPWGKVPVAQGKAAAEACRQHLNAPNIAAKKGTASGSTGTPGSVSQVTNVSGIIQIPAPKFVKAFRGEILFTVDDSRVWIATQDGLFQYDANTGEARRMSLNVPMSPNPYMGSPFSAMAVVRNKLWLGTKENGVLVFDPATQTSTNLTVNDGLLTPDVTNLLEAEDRLWVGFGGNRGGGIGYFDFVHNRFVGTMPELPMLAQSPRRGPYAVNVGPNASAPRSRITGICHLPSGELWMTLMGAVYRYIAGAPGKWEPVKMDCWAQMSGIAANSNFVALPCYDFNITATRDTGAGGLLIYNLRNQKCRRVSMTNGLPNNYLRAIALDGDTAWVGGQAFVASLDLPTGRVEKVCRLQGASRVRWLEIAHNEAWFCSGPALYRMGMDGSVAPAPASLSQSSTSATASTNDLVSDLKKARALMLEMAELGRVYGSRDAADVRDRKAKFMETLRRVAPAFPLLEPREGKGTNRFSRLVLNQNGGQFDGFRFKNHSSEPKNFAWVFAFEAPGSMERWYIEPLEEQSMRGFTTMPDPKRNYTNAPWSGSGKAPFAKVQWLRDGSILPGKEYVIWFSFRDRATNILHVAFDLFPANDFALNRDVIDNAFGLEGEVIEDELGRPIPAQPAK